MCKNDLKCRFVAVMAETQFFLLLLIYAVRVIRVLMMCTDTVVHVSVFVFTAGQRGAASPAPGGWEQPPAVAQLWNGPT